MPKERGAATDATDAKPAGAPYVSEDFYYEAGCVVFTAAYHRKRGYCCGSGCRHCPYTDAERAAASAGRST